MFRFSKSSKGQFFIISAVIMVSVLFSIYAIYQGYYQVDSSIVQDKDTTYLLNDFELHAREILSTYENYTCKEINNTLDTYKLFTERASLESGHFTRMRYNLSRGCITANFNIDVSTRDSDTSKIFSISTPNTQFNWNMFGTTGFSGTDSHIVSVVNDNIDTSNGVSLASGTTGSITYLFNPGSKVIWYKSVSSMQPFPNPNVKIYYWINESPCPGTPTSFCKIDSFNQLPEEFQWFKETIEITGRNGDGSSPVITSLNTTYATRP